METFSKMLPNLIKGPGVCLEEFNRVRLICERSGGSKLFETRLKELNDCLIKIDLYEITSSGFNYAWRPRKNIACKLDRTLIKKILNLQ